MSKGTKMHHLADDAEDTGEEYQVGFGKPPKHRQFRKGQSGNPAGRKRNSDYQDWKDPVFDVLFENVTLPIKGKPVTLPGVVWMLKSMRNNAIKGCHRSFKTLIDANGDRGLKGLWYALKEKHRERSQEEIKEFIEWLDSGMPINGIKKSAS